MYILSTHIRNIKYYVRFTDDVRFLYCYEGLLNNATKFKRRDWAENVRCAIEEGEDWVVEPYQEQVKT